MSSHGAGGGTDLAVGCCIHCLFHVMSSINLIYFLTGDFIVLWDLCPLDLPRSSSKISHHEARNNKRQQLQYRPRQTFIEAVILSSHHIRVPSEIERSKQCIHLLELSSSTHRPIFSGLHTGSCLFSVWPAWKNAGDVTTGISKSGAMIVAPHFSSSEI